MRTCFSNAMPGWGQAAATVLLVSITGYKKACRLSVEAIICKEEGKMLLLRVGACQQGVCLHVRLTRYR